MLPTKRTPEQMLKRCEKLESFGLKCLDFDRKVIHESFPEIELDFSSIDLDSDRSGRNIMWLVIQVTSSVNFAAGQSDIRKQLNSILTGE